MRSKKHVKFISTNTSSCSHMMHENNCAFYTVFIESFTTACAHGCVRSLSVHILTTCVHGSTHYNRLHTSFTPYAHAQPTHTELRLRNANNNVRATQKKRKGVRR